MLQEIDAAASWPCKGGRIPKTLRFDPSTSQTSGLFVAKFTKVGLWPWGNYTRVYLWFLYLGAQHCCGTGSEDSLYLVIWSLHELRAHKFLSFLSRDNANWCRFSCTWCLIDILWGLNLNSRMTSHRVAGQVRLTTCFSGVGELKLGQGQTLGDWVGAFSLFEPHALFRIRFNNLLRLN